MARPLLDRIRDARPDVQIAWTFYSPSAERFAAALGVDVADYLPFDTEEAATALLDALKPAVLVFSKLDVWPVLDLGVRVGHARLFDLPAPLAPRDLSAAGEPFRPYRSLVAWYCWRAADTITPDR